MHNPVEPKLFFANERTFLHCEPAAPPAPPPATDRNRPATRTNCRGSSPSVSRAGMHACVTLASVAMALTAASDATTPLRLTGGVALSFTSIGLMGYAYRTFFSRAARIASRSGERIDDSFGPALLAGVLIAAMLAAAICTLPHAL